MKRLITIRQLDGSELHLNETDMPLTVGSGSRAHIRISAAAPEIGFIGDTRGHLFLQPAAGDDVSLLHNNRYVAGSVWLKSGDEFRTGDVVVKYEVKGDCLVFTVSEADIESSGNTLTPPQTSPPDNKGIGDQRPHLPVQVESRNAVSGARKFAVAAVGGAFLLMLLAALFVIFSRSVTIDVSPKPDSISISAFPPCLKFGVNRLCLPGTYTLNVEKKGYIPFNGTITVIGSADTFFPLVLQKLPGILSLSGTPEDGVMVYSDNQLIGTTPPSRMEISPGQHSLRIARERYQTFLIDIDVTGEGKVQEIDFQLQPDWAEITVSSVPSGATVLVDGKEQGRTPLSLELLSGDHEIILNKALFSRSVLDIEVIPSHAAAYKVALQPSPGHLLLDSSPSGTAVSIDDEYKGLTPLSVALVSQVEHKIILSAPGYRSVTKDVTLKPDEKRELHISLKPEIGTVYLTTHPSDAKVTIDGTPYAATGKIKLSTGSHTLKVSSPGYKSETRTIVPSFGFSQQIYIELRGESGTGRNKSSGNSGSVSEIKTGGGQKLRYVQPVPFTMGASRRQAGRRANEGERTVIMKKPYYLSEKPVTNLQYRQFKSGHSSGAVAGYSLDGDQQPVVNISWEDAVVYLNWLSVKDNLPPFYIPKGQSFVPALPLNNGYRLPSEAEWSFSARKAGSAKIMRYPWQGGFPPRVVVGNYADESARTFLPTVINGYRDGFPVSSPVASYPANPGGFFDMGSNVAEWCHDYYSAYAGSSLRSQADPLGPSSGVHRVIRGASWRDSSITELRLSYRAYHKEPRDNVGFRVARYP